MKYMGLNEVREKYLAFFESKGHYRMHSFPLVPQFDKSLLLVNSGMAPLKPYFTGQETPPSKRVTTCQKCIRTPDIENVGKTARHGTFFEMLGNFSFGDYFKKEAIAWSWEFVTEVMQIPYEKLFVSIYEEDDEAYAIWHEMIGLPDDKITRLGKEDNFWEIGTGPCGPCSEIYIDRGEQYGCNSPDCAVGCDCDRFMEIWNLVFTQYDKDEAGNYNPLEFPNIDTGMGLERMAAVMQGADSIFEVDTIRSVLDYVCVLCGKEYRKNDKNDISIRVVTDHIRSVTFMVADGILPSNEGRGYVLRRLLRRAARHGKLLGIERMFLSEAAEKVIACNVEAYPELKENQEYILRIIRIEEEKFNETINQGLVLLKELIEEIKNRGNHTFSGSAAFRLYDTFGFPVELTEEILEEFGFTLNRAEYDEAMQQQRARARAAHFSHEIASFKDELTEIMSSVEPTVFLGYDVLETTAQVRCLIQDGQQVEKLQQGEEGLVVLDKTPFYAKGGGQEGDKGMLYGETAVLKVINTDKSGDKYVHYVAVEEGSLKSAEQVSAVVDRMRRMDVARNHTATHLLHKALKDVVGVHVNQAGSLVDANRLRFDFTHFERLTQAEVDKIESDVNDAIFACYDVHCSVMPIEEAREKGAIALFGEKYEDKVRVVEIEDESMELCGGTHVDNTGKIGMFKILSEASIASGVRRIEAVTGRYVLEEFYEMEAKLERITLLTKGDRESVVQKVKEAFETIKEQGRRIGELKAETNKDVLAKLLDEQEMYGEVALITGRIDGFDADQMRALGDEIKGRLPKSIIALAGLNEAKGLMVLTATKEVVAAGFNCKDVIKEAAGAARGGGGGRPDMAQAGLGDVNALDRVFAIIRQKAEEIFK